MPITPPSRHANPFATCWTRPGALQFRFPAGQTLEQLIAKLAEQHWQGAIIGPHGSGKSTLLESLKRALIASEHTIHSISLRDRQRWLPTRFLGEVAAKPNNNRLVIVDGYEQLAWLERLRLMNRCCRARAGLLVTSHSPVRIPTLIRLSPDHLLVEQLVADLSAEVSTAITHADVAASHACHGSNVREILFDLYDRHEERRRESNSLPTAS